MAQRTIYIKPRDKACLITLMERNGQSASALFAEFLHGLDGKMAKRARRLDKRKARPKAIET